MISITSLNKIFRANEIETLALNNINLKINTGEFVAIMGPSGCGKSTLLNILGMLDQPSSGSYSFIGSEVAGLQERQRTSLRKGKIGFVFQSFNLIDELTVFENVELPLVYQKMARSERKKRTEEVMDKVGISSRSKHYPSQLSGGQQQRVAIARAVVTRPELILADEPTGNLDSENGTQVMEMLTSLNREGSTVIMVTHNPDDAERAGRIINLFDGKIVTENIRLAV